MLVGEALIFSAVTSASFLNEDANITMQLQSRAICGWTCCIFFKALCSVCFVRNLQFVGSSLLRQVKRVKAKAPQTHIYLLRLD